MKQNRLKICAILFLGFGLTGLHAQEVIPSAGGNVSGTDGSVSYTIGEVIYTTASGPDGSAATSVQQPYEISTVQGIKDFENISLSWKAFPNPTSNFLILQIENDEFNDLYFQMFDINGQILESKKIIGIETRIDMVKFKPGNYFIRVVSEEKAVKTFKIIKN